MKKVLKVLGIVVLSLMALYMIFGFIGMGMIINSVNEGLVVLG